MFTDKMDPKMKAELEREKLNDLMELEGLTEHEVYMKAFSSIVPGICMHPGCNYTTDVEPDQREGWCEACDTNTVESAISLLGVI